MSTRITVGLEFKLSKNYNSIGGTVSVSNEASFNEPTEDLFKRTFSETDKFLDQVKEKAEQYLTLISRK